jgi:transcriptional regulator with XRE-family HTH domain
MSMTTATIIRKKRQSRGETLEAVARACNLNTGTMWRIETGRANPRAETLAALAKHFGCTIDSLMVAA